jgi:hypothetical protein
VGTEESGRSDPVRGEQGQPETYGVCAYSLLELLAMVDEFHDER